MGSPMATSGRGSAYKPSRRPTGRGLEGLASQRDFSTSAFVRIGGVLQQWRLLKVSPTASLFPYATKQCWRLCVRECICFYDIALTGLVQQLHTGCGYVSLFT